MKRRHYFFKENKSQALAVAIIVFAITLALGAGLLFHARSYKSSLALQTQKDGSFALAKTGIDLAAKQIASQTGGPSGSCSGGGGGGATGDLTQTTYTLGGGQVTTSATAGAITSIGNMQDTLNVLTKTVPVPTGGGGAPISTWSKAYGYTTSADRVAGIIQTSDGGYLLAGDFYYGNKNYDLGLVKTDANGTLQWSKHYGQSTTSKLDSMFKLNGGGLIQAPDGSGYLIGGWNDVANNDNFLVIKTDTSGNILWSHIYGYGANDHLMSIQPTYASKGGALTGYILIGVKDYSTNGDVGLVILIDANGAVLNSKIYTHIGTNKVRLFQGHQIFTAGGSADGYIVGGWVGESSGNSPADVLALRLNADLSLRTDGSFGSGAQSYGIVGVDDQGQLIQQTSDAGYILGAVSGASTTRKALVIKINSQGNLGLGAPGTWAATYDYSSSDNQITFLNETSLLNGGYILGSFNTKSTFWNGLLIKTDTNGDIGSSDTWARLYGTTNQTTSEGLMSYSELSGGGLALVGFTSTWGLGSLHDWWLIKTDNYGQLCCTSPACPANFVQTPTITVNKSITIQKISVVPITATTTALTAPNETTVTGEIAASISLTTTSICQ